MSNIPEIFNLPVETSIASGDLIAIFDVSAGQIRKMTQANLTAGVGVTDHGALTGLTDDDHTQYLLANGTRALSADWDAGSFEIRAQTFESDVATGTAPFTIASATAVSNLNADMVDGVHASSMYQSGGTDVAVADGGTGRSSHTAYAVLCGGTSTTAAQQSIASVGNGGQVLTSGGGGALPAFADRITYSLGGAPTTAISPADGTTYYWADAKIGLAPTTTAGDHRLYVPISGKIVAAVLTMYASTATGTGETITGSIRRNDSQDFEVGTVAQAADWRTITSSALDITVTAGDFICFMAAFPTWATNPTGIRCSGAVIIRGTA